MSVCNVSHSSFVTKGVLLSTCDESSTALSRVVLCDSTTYHTIVAIANWQNSVWDFIMKLYSLIKDFDRVGERATKYSRQSFLLHWTNVCACVDKSILLLRQPNCMRNVSHTSIC